MSAKEKIKKNIGRGFLTASFFLFVFLPINTTFAQEITGHMSGITFVCTNGTTDVPCEGFNLLIQAIQGIAKFAVGIALAFSVVVIAYAGARYIIYSDSEGERKKATEMFEKVAIGIFWILAAWLVINLIMTALTSGTKVQQLLNNS
jgi:hypothetical protein